MLQLTKDDCRRIRSRYLYDEKSGPAQAANFLIEKINATGIVTLPKVDNKENADALILAQVQALLQNDQYEHAAIILLGEDIFNLNAQETKRIWRAIEEHDYILIMGAAAMSKSYTFAMRCFLDWLRDPEYTTIKIVSSSKKHATSNLMGNIKMFFEGSLIKLKGEAVGEYLGIDPKNRKAGIEQISIPEGSGGYGTIRGVCHPFPRPTPHPVFGILSRTIIILDECEAIPQAVWEEVGNLLSSSDGTGHIKILGASNPKDRNSMYGVLCEPASGWNSVHPDRDFEWKSARDVFIIRLDALFSENVQQKKVVNHGLQTHQGYVRMMNTYGGPNSPGYWTMCRGWFPDVGINANVVIPLGLTNSLKGKYNFIEAGTRCLALDLALQGEDKVIAVMGQYGMADSFTHMDGVKESYPKPKFVGMIEQIIPIQKEDGNTITIANKIKELAKSLGVQPKNIALDITGNGVGVYDYLVKTWNPDILGVNYASSATKSKIMKEDSKDCYDLYERMFTELWFAASKWIEFEMIKVDPICDMSKVLSQLTDRRYKDTPAGKYIIESKTDYKKRTAKSSPDEADAFTLFIHLIRSRTNGTNSMTGTFEQNEEEFYQDYEEGGITMSYDNEVRIKNFYGSD